MSGSPEAIESSSDNLKIIMEYDTTLDDTVEPNFSQFEVFIGGTSIGNPIDLAIANTKVTLNMGVNSTTSSQSITLTYSKDANNIQDNDGKEARELVEKDVVNDLP